MNINIGEIKGVILSAREVVIPPAPTMTLADLPVGTLVKDINTSYNGQPIVWRILEHDHLGDPAGTTALESKDIITLKCFDAKEPRYPDITEIQLQGNNRYAYSNLLQWLNADVQPYFSWFKTMHQYDYPPLADYVAKYYDYKTKTEISVNPYLQESGGFLSNFSSNFKEALQTTTKVSRYITESSMANYENVQSKIFLLSDTEMGETKGGYDPEGSAYAYYTSSAQSEIGALRQKVIRDTAAIGNYPDARAGQTIQYWLRTPTTIDWSRWNVSVVQDNGYFGADLPYLGGKGVAPACCILSSLVVDNTPDTDGAYIIQF